MSFVPGLLVFASPLLVLGKQTKACWGIVALVAVLQRSTEVVFLVGARWFHRLHY